MKWLEEIPIFILIVIAVLMAMMPFEPEPHLIEKWHMFQAGELTRRIDMGDVLWHVFPSLLLLLKLCLKFR